MIFFHGGLSKPLSSVMPLHNPNGTLKHYIDLALQLSGSELTVGVAEDECNSPAESESLHLQLDLHVQPDPRVQPDPHLICPAKLTEQELRVRPGSDAGIAWPRARKLVSNSADLTSSYLTPL